LRWTLAIGSDGEIKTVHSLALYGHTKLNILSLLTGAKNYGSDPRSRLEFRNVVFTLMCLCIVNENITFFFIKLGADSNEWIYLKRKKMVVNVLVIEIGTNINLV